jgi:NTP pyrophosphatase (non-canonical NTP hydrolase)
MDFDSYLDEARKTAIYPPGQAFVYLALGLASEAGEVAGKVKKWIRDDLSETDDLAGELGDVLWYLAMLADEHGYSLAEIAEKNIDKLRDRQERDALRGSGDER